MQTQPLLPSLTPPAPKRPYCVVSPATFIAFAIHGRYASRVAAEAALAQQRPNGGGAGRVVMTLSEVLRANAEARNNEISRLVRQRQSGSGCPPATGSLTLPSA